MNNTRVELQLNGRLTIEVMADNRKDALDQVYQPLKQIMPDLVIAKRSAQRTRPGVYRVRMKLLSYQVNPAP